MAANRNGIKKGTKVRVEPVRKIQDIKSIGKLLKSEPRNLLLWVLGINNGLRCSDLVPLKVHQLKDLKAGEFFHITERKTGKQNILIVNKSVRKVLDFYLEQIKPDADDYIFSSRKGSHMSSQSTGRLIKGWTKAINLSGNYGSHTLRKTWAYQQRVKFHVPIEIITKRLNHSNPAVTMRYVGIEDKEVCDVLLNEIG
ncbi:MAG: tyrosine-type recombinase/integrase [Desulfobacterales bacterium]|nr:tyrosine-type recombinase/integrase [Desulfobacterales bacterium]MDD4071668.1 tyrosine-type recombinase/integrase [Desulfobacterales bacterium]MDD4393579.1 tyrosine-type recombinase/integrase [Desulfobacterales bacterium]